MNTSASGVRVVKGACPHDCPDTCALETTVQNGVAIKVAGQKDHPWTDGALCTKVSRYLERTYAADRVLHPHRRVGGKGPGKGSWERISWDEAVATIAARFQAIIDSPEGAEGICPYSYAGTMGLLNFAGMDRRFFNHLGASLLDRTLCSSAGKVGIKLTLGGGVGMDPERVDGAKLVLIWGSNPITSNLHYWSRVQEAKRQGARVVVIDPYRSLTAEKGTASDDAANYLPRIAFKMATGSGKTVVMAMLIAWALCNRGRVPGDTKYPRHVLAVCPNLTIKERLQVLRPDVAGNYYDAFDLVCHVAFDRPPRTRRQRVAQVRGRDVFARYGDQARAVLEALLDKYADAGLKSFESLDILKVDPLSAFGTPMEIINLFGGKANYLTALHQLEAELYLEEA